MPGAPPIPRSLRNRWDSATVQFDRKQQNRKRSKGALLVRRGSSLYFYRAESSQDEGKQYLDVQKMKSVLRKDRASCWPSGEDR